MILGVGTAECGSLRHIDASQTQPDFTALLPPSSGRRQNRRNVTVSGRFADQWAWTRLASLVSWHDDAQPPPRCTWETENYGVTPYLLGVRPLPGWHTPARGDEQVCGPLQSWNCASPIARDETDRHRTWRQRLKGPGALTTPAAPARSSSTSRRTRSPGGSAN